jgi:hypothetical protein
MQRSPYLHRPLIELALLVWLGHLCAAPLEYSPAPPDNPLKGFVPYLGDRSTFPHSMEWDYTRLSDVMTGPNEFSWESFEAKLRAAAARGHQFYARFYLEWPGRRTGVPQYLIEDGLTLRRWTNTNTQPFPPAVDFTPDYEDPRLRQALTNFIHAFGARYDGDPRLGFVGLGLLGTWGEWHNHPNNQWLASKTVQREVLDSYQAAFRKTRLVARYPAGPNDPTYADNSHRPIGYHDDSFAWATVHTGESRTSWFFESRLRRAGALDKWRSQPIGGEVRPEVWDCLFDEPSCAPPGQEFLRCVRTVHASWLSNEGVFRNTLPPASRERALHAARFLGYELFVAEAVSHVSRTGEELMIMLSVTNTGVAPFYYPWPVELGAYNAEQRLVATWPTPWTLSGIQPGKSAAAWATRINVSHLPDDTYQLLARAPNPLQFGSPVRFANASQDLHLTGWLSLGAFERRPPPPQRATADPPSTNQVLLTVEFIRPSGNDAPSTSPPEPLRTFIANSVDSASPKEQASAEQIQGLGLGAPTIDHVLAELITGPGVVSVNNQPATRSLLLNRLRRHSDFETWTAPPTTVRSGELARIELTEEVELRTGIHPDAIVVRGRRPRRLDSPYLFTATPIGAWLDILPRIAEDASSVDLQVSVSVTEFVGYAGENADERVLVWQGRERMSIAVPRPQLRLRQISGQGTLPQDRCLVLGSWALDLETGPAVRSSSLRRPRFALASPPLLVVISAELPPSESAR